MPNKKHIYFVGIGGSALNAIAQVLHDRGYKVSGSDIVESAVTKSLIEKGIKVHIGQQKENINDTIDEVVISSAVLNGPGLVEVDRAKELGIPVHKRTVWWSRLMSEARIAVAVAGTHGKTSTTAMVGAILQHAGLDPTVLVGGDVPDFGGTVRLGSKEVIVVEADEYDKAFHACRPTYAIITNIDYDHPDTYPTPADYVQSFKKFARLLNKRQGTLVAYGDDPLLRKSLAGWKTIIRWYGRKNVWPGLKLSVPGEHMLLNATAAAKIAHELHVDKKVINKALKEYRGVSRRFESIGEFKGIPVYDDYAHHPAEIRATLKAAISKYKKVAVLFQPHQRIRTKQFSKDFAAELKAADYVGIMDLFQVAGREADIDVSSKDIIQELEGAKEVKDDDIIQFMTSAYEKKVGVIMIMGAGDISNKVRKALKDG